MKKLNVVHIIDEVDRDDKGNIIAVGYRIIYDDEVGLSM